jgi:hypothetical protein
MRRAIDALKKRPKDKSDVKKSMKDVLATCNTMI